MAIQTRRGSYNDFDPEKLLPGEWAAVQSDDPASTDGQSIYMCFAPGQTKRMATYEDMVQNVDNSVEDVKNQFASGMQAATEAANTAATSATEATSAANTAADRADLISDSIQAAIEGTLINDMSQSNLTVYSSKKIEDDFRKKADIIDIAHGGTGETTVEAMLKAFGLAFGKGDTFNLGNYIAGGYITSGATNFSCYILLPHTILPEVSKVSVSGLVRIRQNGKYILGQDLNVNLSMLDTTYQINTGRYGIAVSIDSGLSNADNNDSAAAFFGNLVITFS